MALSKNEINDKFKNAKVGFDTWRKTSLSHRKSILRKYKNLLKDNTDLLCRPYQKNTENHYGILNLKLVQWLVKSILPLNHTMQE